MKSNCLFLSVFLLNLASLKTIAQNTIPPGNKPAPVASSNMLKSSLDRQVDSVARQYIQKSNTVGLSIGIWANGEVKTYGYGETVKGKNKLPDANTIFEIGSITKAFTASILAYYVNQGKISLTDPITKYLPDSLLVNPELNSIKIINLINHTSGLSSIPPNFLPNMDPLNPYIHYDEALLFANLKTCKPATVPGEVYAYSNLSAGLLGVILQRISGKTYEQLVKQVISLPLKMNSTSQSLSPQAAKQFAAVYNAKGAETKPWDFKALAACGCLRSTVNDLLAYAKNNIHSDNIGLSAAFDLTHQITFSKGPLIGLGWHVFQIKGANYYWHNGGTGGSRSFLIFSIEQKMAAVVLSNAEVGVDEVGLGIFKKMLGK